jgi:hypothetical protein
MRRPSVHDANVSRAQAPYRKWIRSAGLSTLAFLTMVACDSGGSGPNHDVATARTAALSAETPEVAAARRQEQRERRRAQLDELKRRIMVADEATRRDLLANYHSELRVALGEMEGVSVPAPAPAAAPTVTSAQQQALLSKMKSDLRNPADQAAWSRVKREELGR